MGTGTRRIVKRALLHGPAGPRRALLQRVINSRARWAARRGRGDTPTSGDRLPLPPPELRFMVSGTTDDRFFLTSGQVETELIESILRQGGVSIKDLGAILDFGCGCGRLLRWWAGLSGPTLHGCDYNPDLVGWCADNLPFARVTVNGLEPPLPYAEGSFDLVYALSVFTHLPAELQHAWMAELQRVVRPSGLLLFTVHGDAYAETLPRRDREAFARGELVTHFAEMVGTNACAAYHPRRFVEEELTVGLEVLPIAAERLPHDPRYQLRQECYLARRPQ